MGGIVIFQLSFPHSPIGFLFLIHPLDPSGWLMCVDTLVKQAAGDGVGWQLRETELGGGRGRRSREVAAED